MTEDIFIGFKREPQNLEVILRREGYTEKEKVGEFTVYTQKNDSWPQLFVCNPNLIKHRAKYWDVLGVNVVLELAINYHPADGSSNEVQRLSKIIIKELKGIAYDKNFEKFKQ